jgi:hypothetical protein
MALTFCDEHVDALAESLNGDETSEPFDGLLIVTPARAGRVIAMTSEEATDNARKIFIDFLLQLKVCWRELHRRSFCDRAEIVLILVGCSERHKASAPIYLTTQQPLIAVRQSQQGVPLNCQTEFRSNRKELERDPMMRELSLVPLRLGPPARDLIAGNSWNVLRNRYIFFCRATSESGNIFEKKCNERHPRNYYVHPVKSARGIV